MNTIDNYLNDNVLNPKNTIVTILNYLINDYSYNIHDDYCMNDIRTIILVSRYHNNLKICTSIVFKEGTFIKMDSVEVFYKNNIYKFIAPYR